MIKMTKTFFERESTVRVGGKNSKMADPITGKMGVLYVALQAVRTCGKDLPCYKACYAVKEERVYTSAHRCYARNTDVALSDPDEYFDTIRAAIRFYGLPRFRWHTGGDIPNISYFRAMRRIAGEFPNVHFLAFTKRYDIVNFSLATDGRLPENLVVVFSDWGNWHCPNPYNLPVANVRFKGGNNGHLPANCYTCSGNCATCHGSASCFNLRDGETMALPEH